MLVIDDSLADAYITFRRLKRLPQRTNVEIEDRFEQALFQLSTGRFDIAFVDHHLGARNGLELISLARRRGVDVPLVLLTGSDDPAVEGGALDEGATDFLSKSELTERGLGRTLRYGIQRKEQRDK